MYWHREKIRYILTVRLFYHCIYMIWLEKPLYMVEPNVMIRNLFKGNDILPNAMHIQTIYSVNLMVKME